MLRVKVFGEVVSEEDGPNNGEWPDVGMKIKWYYPELIFKLEQMEHGYSQGLWSVADAINGLSTSRAIFACQGDDFTLL